MTDRQTFMVWKRKIWQ